MDAFAVVAHAPRQVAYRSVTVPDPSDHDVVVRVTHSWISNGTESSYIRGERIAGDTPWKDGDRLPFPIVSGYQKVGVVEWVGSEVTDLKMGETVFCTISKIEGMFDSYGGHVSPAVTPYSQIWKIPKGLDPVSVSGLVLTQVGYNCGIRPQVDKGDATVVIGDGMVGHWAAQTLLHRGARVCLLGKHPERLNRFAASPESITMNINDSQWLDKVQSWATGGLQAVIDTVGSVAAIEAFYPLMRDQAHIVSAGFHGHSGKIDIQRMRAKEVTLHAPSGWTRERMDATLSLIAQGILTTDNLITHHFPIAEAAAAFDLILSRREPVLGVILDW